ncbi:MAG TPA: polymer-forming cytoskeletal protein [Candidatus Binatia bacterium]|nr:polymer-forming cytoskeletal protein [Candidatus Binatia bacterium]
MSETMQTVRRTASQSVTMLRAATGLGGNKTSMPEPANEAEAKAHRPEPTVLSGGALFKGSIVTNDSVEIRGKIEGDVRAASITIYPGAKIKGDITADVILVQGDVEGRIQAQDVRLQGGANVVGEIVHGSLGIDTTAIFEGTIKRIATHAPAAAE